MSLSQRLLIILILVMSIGGLISAGFIVEEDQSFSLKESKQTSSSPSDTLFQDAYHFFEYLRAETGVYRDAARFEGAQFHPASTATTGMGLLAIAIADEKGWISNGDQLVLETLKSMMGMRDGFDPDRNKTGLFRHFIDLETGERAWNSEYSTIDTGILVAGALFCKQHFSANDSIGLLADALYLSIDWASTIANATTGGIYRTQNEYGEGSGITLPFNEYMLVAWLAKHDVRKDTIASNLWANHYADPVSLPKSTYQGIEVLTDFPGNFLSGFVPQFAYYLCNPFTTDTSYLRYMDNAMRVDTLWWRNNTNAPPHVWGFGAGSSCIWTSSGYSADNIMSHPGTICSPHIIAGNIPVFPGARQDLDSLLADSLGKYAIQDSAQSRVLWRFSEEDSTWKACDIQGIDYSTLLLGLAAHPDQLGTAFYEVNNQYDFPTSSRVNAAPELGAFPVFCFNQDSINLIDLCVYTRDVDHPYSMLQWTLTGNDSISLQYDSITNQISVSAIGGFMGTEEFLLIVEDSDGAKDSSNIIISFSDPCSPISGIELMQPDNLNLAYQNYPNPFQDLTYIPFYVMKPSLVQLTIYDGTGAKLESRKTTNLSTGNYVFKWDGTNASGEHLPAGMYLYTLTIGRDTFNKRMILQR